MRVTNSMMINQFLYNMNSNLGRLEKYHNQLETGKKITRPSDDPVGVTRSLQARTDLSKIERYTQNVGDAKAWLTQTETSLMEMNEIIKRAYDLAVDSNNSTKTPEDLAANAKELRELEKQLIQSANTTYGGRYVFGGYNTVDEPFEIVGEGNRNLIYNGVDLITGDGTALDRLEREELNYEIGPGVNMKVSTNGIELFGRGDGNIFNVIAELTDALENSDLDGIDASIGKLQNAQEEILSHLAEVGGKYNRLEMVESRYTNDKINYTAVKSSVEDVDQAEAIMEFMMAQMVYRSSLSVGARIIQPTLVDFLG